MNEVNRACRNVCGCVKLSEVILYCPFLGEILSLLEALLKHQTIERNSDHPFLTALVPKVNFPFSSSTFLKIVI